jgi:heat shock protein HslJ
MPRMIRVDRRRLVALAIGLMVVTLVGACGSSSATASPAGPGGIEGSWRLLRYTTPDGREFTVPAAVTPGITFANGTASGNAGCNTFTGPYTINGGTIAIGPLATTKMACQDPMATVETAYLQALDQVTEVSADGDNLKLSAPGDRPALVFVRA